MIRGGAGAILALVPMGEWCVMTVFAVVQLTQHIGEFLLAMPLYIGPDVFLPITSALAAIVGVLLMFWNRVVTFVARLFGRGAKASVTQASEHKPDRPS